MSDNEVGSLTGPWIFWDTVLGSNINLLSLRYRTRFPHDFNYCEASSSSFIDTIITTDLTTKDRKSVEFTATVGYWYYIVVVLGILFATGGMFYQSTLLLKTAGILYVGLISLLIICVNPKMDSRSSNIFHQISAVEQMVSVHAIIPFVGIFGMLLGLFYLTGRLSFLGGIQLVFVTLHALFLEWCVHDVKDNWSRHQVSLFAMAPLSIVIFAVMILAEAAMVTTSSLQFLFVIVAACIGVLGTIGWIWIGYGLYQKTRKCRLDPIRSPRVRTALFVVEIGAILSSAFIIGLLLNGVLSYVGVLSGSYGIVEPIFRGIEQVLQPLPWSATVSVFVYLLLLVSPLVISLSMWLYYIGTQLLAQRQILAQATRFEPPWGDRSSVEMYLAELDGGLAQTIPLWLHGRSIIVVDTGFADLLNSKELQTVYHHEMYHIKHHHPWVIDILLGFAPAVWVNVMTPYFCPPVIESNAHAYAENMTNRDVCMSARKKAKQVEKQQLEAEKQASVDADSSESSIGVRQRYLKTVSLIYGGLVETRGGARF